MEERAKKSSSSFSLNIWRVCPIEDVFAETTSTYFEEEEGEDRKYCDNVIRIWDEHTHVVGEKNNV